MNSFAEDLKYSREAEDQPFWKEIYYKAFPNLISITNSRSDGQVQRLGIDRTIVLKSGKAIYIDEKVRRKNYNDILLEYIANDKSLAEGWVEKSLFCDYIAYAIIPRQMCYLLPVPQLQSVWTQNKDSWIKKHGSIKAENKNYKTINCPVPVDVLFSKIGSSLKISFGKD